MSPRFADMLFEPGADPRVEPPVRADEQATLVGFLGWQRHTLELKCAGLDPVALARRAVEPSTMSLLGLVRHMADVERHWFRRVMARQDAPAQFSSPDDPDGDFDEAVADPEVVDAAWAAWRAEVAFAESLVAGAPDFDMLGNDSWWGPITLRWVVIHMIEEYARHNGHADLLRQLIDGAVGQ